MIRNIILAFSALLALPSAAYAGTPENDSIPSFYEFTDIDLDNYIYPEKGATINPNIVEFDVDNDKVLSIDTINQEAVLEFAKATPKLYRGAIVPVVHDSIAHALFVLEVVSSDSKTATIHYRKAAITELFFNQTIRIADTNPQTRSTPRDYDSQLMKQLKLFRMYETGLDVKMDKTSINFNSTEFDLDFGDFWIFAGKSINCPFKRVKAVLGGDITASGSFSIEPSFKASKGICKDIKQAAFYTRKIFFVHAIPVDIDFNIDICGDLNISSQIDKAFQYAQNIGGTLHIQVGGEYNFETGVLTPLNELKFTPVKANPKMSNVSPNLNITLDASVFPRFKLYFYEFKLFGFGCDVKPVFAKLELKSTAKEGNTFFNTIFSLGSSAKAFVYVWDWEARCNINIADTETFERIWWSYKSPGDIKDETADNHERLNYGGQSQCSYTITDLQFQDEEQSVVPADAAEMSIEVEPMGTIPDPAINPEFYSEMIGEDAPARVATRASGKTWYSYGKKYYKLKSDGTVDVPYSVTTPAGEDFKLVARILDGDGNPVREVGHPTRVGIKNYNCVQRVTASGMSVNFVIKVRNYGAYVNEECTMPDGLYSNATYENGSISGYIIYEGKKMPSTTFMGCGTNHYQVVPAPMRGPQRKTTMTEALDYARWASDYIPGYDTEGALFYDTEWNGMKATVASLPDGGGTWTYVGNFPAKVEDSEMLLSTISFQEVADDETVICEYKADAGDTNSGTYDLSGRPVSDPQSGIVIREGRKELR